MPATPGIRDFAGDPVLQVEDFAALPPIDVAPNLVILPRIDDGHMNAEYVLLLLQSAGDDHLYIQLPPKRGDVELLPLVPRDGAERPHLKVLATHLREAVDDLVGDAVTEELGLGVAAEVLEREHGDRMNTPTPPGGVVGKADAPEQVREPTVAAQALPARVEGEPNEPVGAFLQSAFQPGERLVRVAEGRVNERQSIGRGKVSALSQGLKLVQHRLGLAWFSPNAEQVSLGGHEGLPLPQGGVRGTELVQRLLVLTPHGVDPPEPE